MFSRYQNEIRWYQWSRNSVWRLLSCFYLLIKQIVPQSDSDVFHQFSTWSYKVLQLMDVNVEKKSIKNYNAHNLGHI